MCECFAFIYVCVPRVCLVPVEVRLGALKLELQEVVKRHVSAGR